MVQLASLAPSQPGGRRTRRLGRLIAEQLFAAGVVALAAAIRALLDHPFPGPLPLMAFVPAVLAAALFGGWRGGGAALVLSALIGLRLFWTDLAGPSASPGAGAVNLALYLAICVLMAAVGQHMHALVARLQDTVARARESELRYRTLFDSMSEGFDLCAPIRDGAGRLVDWRVLAINPALQRMMAPPKATAGSLLSEFAPNVSRARFAAVEEVLATGKTLKYEFRAPVAGRVYEVHLSRVAGDRFAQLFIDITERKQAQDLQAQLFSELNHRIKNNLQIVSALLRMQAAAVSPEARQHLLKAVARIQTISDIHGSLNRNIGTEMGDVDFGQYLADLCARLSQSMLDDGAVRIEVRAQPSRLPLEQAVPLGMIVNELVTNAAKYAYPAGATGVIRVSFEADDTACRLGVSDDGVGLPKGFDARAAGLGMKVVNALAGQIGARLQIDGGPGTSFSLVAPCRKLAAESGD